MNANAQNNGENRYLRNWCKTHSKHESVIVVDVGANEGEFTSVVAHELVNATIHCFEPNPETFARLSKRFANNPKIILNNLGLDSKSGELLLHDYADANGSGHASMHEDTFGVIYPAKSKSTKVQVITLDEYAARVGLKNIDYVKIDVEGFEQQVFQGMQGLIARGDVDTVQFEFNAHNVISGLTLYRVAKLFPGYSIWKILANGVEPVIRGKYNSRVEIFKYANYVLNRNNSNSAD
jgi:FkbM family methyltransferase